MDIRPKFIIAPNRYIQKYMAPPKQPEFIHLRVHSSYSLSEGAITPDEMVRLCIKNNMPAVAITDSGNMFGSLEFSKACSGKGIQPIIGCIMKVDMYEGKTRKEPMRKDLDKVVLIAKDKEGYQNLLKLISISFFDVPDGQEPHITLTNLKEYSAGIILLTGGVSGPIGRAILSGQEKEAENYIINLKECFSDRLYVELQRHGTDEEAKTETSFINLAIKYSLPIVATNDAYFATKDMHEAHDALLCIADGRYTSEQDRRKVTPEHYFKSQEEMAKLFADLPEAIANTVSIAKRCFVMSDSRAPMLPQFPCEDGRDAAEELRAVAYKGLEARLVDSVYQANATDEQKSELKKQYFERIDFELNVIIKMDFPGYFLIVSDFIRWSKRNNIPVGPGRGSGAGSVVAWALEITDLDPIRFGLLFERFLNPERVSMPDFDIDFCQERREEVILYVQSKYGKDRVAQIITFGKLQARAVLRDVGRVLQMSYGQVDRISKMIPFNPIDPVTLSKAISMDKSLQEARDTDPEIAKLLDMGLKLEGLNRHASTHAAGVVIADRPLYELIPVYRDPRSDMPVCGYSMKYAESAGLVKFDFLGLKTLTVISKTIEFIKRRGIELNISKIPINDKATFAMLTKGDSTGVFQLESAGMKDTLRKLRPDNIEDIIALISLYRPGPMDMIPSYIARKHGQEAPDYMDSMLEGILKETYGVIIYQEQVMQIAQVMGGYSLGGADLLRRAMGKKIAAEMDAQRKIFVDGAIKNGVDKNKASGIFDLVAKFAGYGFNKSHAAAYAMISYQTGYLKANYPVEFLAASMNLEINDTDKINMFRQEAVSQGIKILLPDINISEALFVPESDYIGLRVRGLEDKKEPFLVPNTQSPAPNSIRYALGALKNVGVAAIENMVSERKKNGKFKDIFDFASRLGGQNINKRMMENLIKSGSFDLLNSNRRQIHTSCESIIKYGNAIAQEKNSNQVSMFGGDSGTESPKPKLQDIDDWRGTDRLAMEFEAMGMYIGNHPLTEYEKALNRMMVIPSADFSTRIANGSSKVKVAGVVISKRLRSSPRGRFATLSISDPTGLFELSIFNEDILESSRDLIENGTLLFIHADARKDDGGVRIIAEQLTLLDDAMKNYTISIKVFLNNTNALTDLKKILGAPGKGRSRISVVIEADSRKVEITLPDPYAVTIATLGEIKGINGVMNVSEM